MPVFEPAVTDKPQGSGLGLAIVREIVHQHKGTVSYTTQLGKGTTFHLKFPIPTATPANSEEKPQAWREDYRRRSQDDEYRWSGDSPAASQRQRRSWAISVRSLILPIASRPTMHSS